MAAIPMVAPLRFGWRRPSLDLVLGLALLVVVGVFTVLPVGFVLLGSFDVGDKAWRWGLGAWQETFTNPRALKALGYSFLLVLRVPLGAVLGFVIAWLIVRIRIPGGAFIEFMLWVAFFLPPLPIAIGWTLLLDAKYGLVNRLLMTLPFVHRAPLDIHSVGGILWVHLTLTTVPVMVILLAPAIRRMDASLEQSARLCGARAFQTLRHIVFPVLSGAFLTALLAGVIRGLETFEIEQLLGIPAGIYVYATRIYNLVTVEPPLFPQAMALSTLFLVILFVLAFLYQTYTSRRSYATISGRGATFGAVPAGRWRYAASAICWLYVAIGIVLPLALLIVGSFMRLFGFFTIASPFTQDQWLRVLHDPLFLQALRNSMLLGLSVGLLGTAIYALMAYAIVRSPLAGKRLLSLLVWLPWAIPGILLGVALLWLLLTLPGLRLLYGSMGALILALIIQSLPIGTQMLKTSFWQIGRELEQAARVCGAGWVRTYRLILLPLVAPMLVSIAVLSFMSAIRDISTTVLLATASTQPLSLLMLQFAAGGESESAAVTGIILSALAVTVAVVARRLGTRLSVDAV